MGELVRSLLYFPDDTVGWVPFALAKAMQLHRRHQFDVIYTVGPPRSAALIGLSLKVLYGIPWVLDYEDPWYPPRRPLRRMFERWLEAAMVHRADAIVVMTSAHAEELGRSYQVPREKLAVSGCGFDEDDFLCDLAAQEELLTPGPVHLSHFGSVYPGSSGKFFPALIGLLREHPEARERFRVNIIGFPDEAIRQYAEDPLLRDSIRIHGFVKSRRTVIQLMRSSDWLLLYWGRPEFSRYAWQERPMITSEQAVRFSRSLARAD
jgi:glycosyltransferase involved in cell wall biosynthesis